MQTYKEKLFRKHDDFDCSTDSSRREILQREITDLVEGLETPDAQDLHILGLIKYDTSDTPDKLRRAQECFAAALRVDEKYNMARLYLAHCLHDLGELGAALENYMQVDRLELVNDFAFWRYAKLCEQIGYCLHKLGSLAEGRHYFEQLLAFYRRETFETVGDPMEIYECLSTDDPLVLELRKLEPGD